MGIWRDRALPWLTDRALRGDDIGALRARACSGLRGHVLELGFGSGLNVRYYPTPVAAVSAVEPADYAWHLAERRRRASAVPIARSGLDGQRLAEDTETFDTVLTTFTLCSIPDLTLALGEVRRVLRPGGTLHFLEHGIAPDPGVAKWQRRLEPLQRRVAGGCHLTRDIPALLIAAGFELEQLESDYLLGSGASSPVGYVYLGRAVIGS